MEQMDDQNYQFPFHIRTMNREDLPRVVEIHIKAFPDFFLTLLGKRVLWHYYRSVLIFPGSIALVAEDKDESVLGFVVGFSNPQDFYTFFKAQRWKLLPSIFFALLRRPYLLRKVLNNADRVDRNSNSFANVTELSSIAVAPLFKKRGIGGSLLQAFVTTARKISNSPIELTTDAEHNTSTRQFYEGAGFTLNGFEQRGARRLCIYHLTGPSTHERDGV